MKNHWKTLFLIIIFSAVGMITLSIVLDWNSFFYLPDLQNFTPDSHAGNSNFSETPKYVRTIGGYIISFLVSVLLLYLLPSQILNIANQIRFPISKTAKLGFFGFVLVVFILLIGFGSVLSFGTFPFIFLLFLILFISIWMGYVAISFKIGRFFQIKSGWLVGSPIVAFLIGHTMFFALFKIPFVNLISVFICLSLGFGSVVITRFGTNQPWSLSVLKEGYR